MKPRDAARALEDAAKARSSARYELCLFVAGPTPQSSTALRNIVDICEQLLPDRYDLTVVDVYEHPARAKAANIVVIPTLLRQAPLPLKRLVGDMSDREAVLRGLDLSSE